MCGTVRTNNVQVIFMELLFSGASAPLECISVRAYFSGGHRIRQLAEDFVIWNERQIAEIIPAQPKSARRRKKDVRLQIAIAAMPLVTIVVALSLTVMWLH